MSLRGYVKKTNPALWVTAQEQKEPNLLRSGSMSFCARPSLRMLKDTIATRKSKPALWTTTPAEAQRRSKELASKRQVKRIRRQSKTARKASAGYATKAMLFIAAADQLGVTCPVVAMVPEIQDGNGAARVTENHHWAGRGYGGRGPLLMDERLWIAISRKGHQHIEQHCNWARANGFLAPVGQYNKPVPQEAAVVRLANGGMRVENNSKKDGDAGAETV